MAIAQINSLVASKQIYSQNSGSKSYVLPAESCTLKWANQMSWYIPYKHLFNKHKFNSGSKLGSKIHSNAFYNFYQEPNTRLWRQERLLWPRLHLF
jgi:hypothetical protein